MNRFKFLVYFLFFFVSHTLHADTVLEMQNLFSGRNIYAPTLLFDDGVYKMWYSGWQDDGNYQDNIYYRTSTDNITWSFPTTVLTPKYIENNAGLTIKIKHIGDPSITKHYNIVNNTYQYTMFYTLCKEPCEQKNNQIWSAVSNDGINWIHHKILLDDDNLGSAEPSAVVEPSNNSRTFWKVYYVDRLDATKIKMVTVDGNRNVINKKVVYSHEGIITNPEVKNINNVWHLFFNNYFGSETLERVSLNQSVSQSNESWVNYSVLIANIENKVCSTTTPGVLPSREDITQYHLYYGIVENDLGICDLSNHNSIHRWTYKVQPNYPPTVSINTEGDITEGKPPFTIKFIGNGSDPEQQPLNYLWNFDDGFTSTEISPNHTFTSKGSYTVTLTVTDIFGETSSKSIDILVSGNVYTVDNLILPSGSGEIQITPFKKFYEEGESIILTAVPKDGYKFTQWSGDISASTIQITLTIVSNISVTAEFESDAPMIVSPNKLTIIEGGISTVNISGGTGSYQAISGNDSVIEALLTGTTIQVSAKSEGSTTITVSDSDNKTVTIQVTVVIKPNEKPSSGIGKAIIIAGGGAHQQNSLFQYSDELSKEMYRLLSQRGYRKSDIIYMNPHDWQDINGDGVDDKIVDYQLFDPQNELEGAFTEASQGLSEGNQFVFYIHGHARPDSLSITRDYKLSAFQLKTLLDKIPSGIQQIIIIDSCYSGSFLDELSGNANRIVMTSSDDHTLAWNAKYTNFSSKLIRTLKIGKNLLESFQATEDMMKGEPGLFGEQSPQLDDDGDGYYSTADGSRSARISIGKEGVHAAEPPIITLVHPRIELPKGQVTETLWVKVSLSNEEIKTVRAILIKPGFKPTEYQGEDTLFEREELELIYNAAKERYEIDYVNFRDGGIWRIMYQAQGIDGEWSEADFGEVNADGTDGVIVRVEFNQSIYHIGEQLRLDISVNGNEVIDLYVALFFPQDFFQTITYPLNFNMVNAIIPYKTNIELSGEKIFPIMNFVLPPGIPIGIYSCYGLSTISGADPWNIDNWIHFDFKSFEIK